MKDFHSHKMQFVRIVFTESGNKICFIPVPEKALSPMDISSDFPHSPISTLDRFLHP